MPGKNKPKRLDRNKSWRVQRRKKKIRLLASGINRVRAKRPKNKSESKKIKEPAKMKKIAKKE